jgi:hypothetical protein
MSIVILPEKLLLMLDAGQATLEIVIHADHFAAVYALLNSQQVTLSIVRSYPIDKDEPITPIIAQVE